jgi:hypothetical protein
MSVRIERLNVGSALLQAMLYPEPEKGGRGNKGLSNSTVSGFDKSLLSQARTVFRHLPRKTDKVLAGREFPSKAYEQAHHTAGVSWQARPELHQGSDAYKAPALPLSYRPENTVMANTKKAATSR